MAVVSQIKCETCGKQVHVSHGSGTSPPKICHQCYRAAETKTREQDLADIAALPFEERLRRVEAWIYDYRAPIPLSEVRF